MSLMLIFLIVDTDVYFALIFHGDKVSLMVMIYVSERMRMEAFCVILRVSRVFILWQD